MAGQKREEYILGLDIGANSIGWALLQKGKDGEPIGLFSSDSTPSLGSFIFEEGVDNFEMGEKAESRNKARRDARLSRRQSMNRARRQKKIFATLQRAELLPKYPENSIREAGGEEQARHLLLNDLDQRLLVELEKNKAFVAWLKKTFQKINQKTLKTFCVRRLPWLLRAYGLDHKLSKYAFGRALYHLAQRRGFLSNSKANKTDKDGSEVYDGIKELRRAMTEVDSKSKKPQARTLGEFLAKLGDFGQCGKFEDRIRRRWTHRDMYSDEFESLWQAQAGFHPELESLEIKFPGVKAVKHGKKFVKKRHWEPKPAAEAIRKALFFQRPLKSVKHLIGKCELEKGKRRCPWADPLAQEFRCLQFINNLRIMPIDGDIEVPLDDSQRQIIRKELEYNTKLTWKNARIALGLKASGKDIQKFNYERGGEKHLKGNTIVAPLYKIFGERWFKLTEEEQQTVFNDLRSFIRPEALVRRILGEKALSGTKLKEARNRAAWKKLNATPEEANEVSEIPIEEGYCSYSRPALRKLIDLMREGVDVISARDMLYKDAFKGQSFDLLPSLKEAVGDLRNPVVARCLTMLRRLVNAIIDKHGKPAAIRIELAREVKSNAKQRADIQKQNETNRKQRDEARQKICAKKALGITNPTGGDILKLKLWEEQDKCCAYSGKAIPMTQLFNSNVDIDHIIPYSRCQNNSQINKVVCFAEENRNRKGNKTPIEAYRESDPKHFEKIYARLSKLVKDGKMPRRKFEIFMLEGEELKAFCEGFSERMLNDTRYASRLALQFLATLYGEDIKQGLDVNRKKVVQATGGMLTSTLRGQWGLNKILDEDGQKSRSDHRHHAIDAVVVACTSPRLVKEVVDQSKMPGHKRRRKSGGKPLPFGMLDAPWQTFEADVRAAIEKTTTVHQRSSRVRGRLHKDTIYSPRFNEKCQPDPNGEYSHIRCKIWDLKPKNLEDIIDGPAREAIKAKLQELGQTDPSKAFADNQPENWPQLTGKNGHVTRIRHVRCRKKNSTKVFGKKSWRARHVENDGNHHMTVFEIQKKGKKIWDCEVVSLADAMERYATQRRIALSHMRSKKVDATTANAKAQEQEPIIRRQHPTNPEARFLFTLSIGDFLEIDEYASVEGEKDKQPTGKRALIRIRGIYEQANGQKGIQAFYINDARKKKEVVNAKEFIQVSVSALLKWWAQKVWLTRLGEVRYADKKRLEHE